MNDEQFTDLREMMRDTHEKVGQIHTTVFGVEGQGGLVREVAELKKHKEEMTTFKAKLLGMVTAASALAAFVGGKLSSFFTTPPK